MKKTLLLSSGLILGFGLFLTLPTLAETGKQIFNETVIFNQIVKIKKNIQNPSGPVHIKDDLKVSGAINGEINAAKVQILNNGSSAQSVLSSSNLQDALDNELAIDLSSLLAGTTWTIANTTNQTTYHNTTGQVTFVDADTLTIDSGRFAAAGLNHQNELLCAALSGEVSYQILDNQILYLSWTDVNTQQFEAILPVFASSTNSLSVLGNGGCPSGATNSISTLTLVE